MAEMDHLFRMLIEAGGSDLHVFSNRRPLMRIHGDMTPIEIFPSFSAEDVKQLLWEIMPERSRKEFVARHDSDFAYDLPGHARMRGNVFVDRFGMGGVFRVIPTRILTMEELGLPASVTDLCFLTKGLVIVTGPTGSGKSTTLASMVDFINLNRPDHIITIEDPIEFVHEDKRCAINQREVCTHTESFATALRAALREDPDIVLVGEMRDLETIEIALETAETGHLVLATLHTNTAASTVDRIIDVFPADRQNQVRTMLSTSLKAVIAQTLCKRRSGGRVAAYEVLLVDSGVASLIRDGKTFQIPSAMQVARGKGMFLMNEFLAELVAGRVVEPAEAYLKSVDKDDLLSRFKKVGVPFDVAQLGGR